MKRYDRQTDRQVSRQTNRHKYVCCIYTYIYILDKIYRRWSYKNISEDIYYQAQYYWGHLGTSVMLRSPPKTLAKRREERLVDCSR